MIINNYTLIEFFNQSSELINEYVVALRYIKPMATKREVYHMKLREVEDIKQALSGGTTRDLIAIVANVQQIKEETVLNIKIITFFRLVNSIKKQIETISQAEQNSLQPSYTNVKWEQVNGSERMARFGIYNTLDRLSGGDCLKFSQIMEMDYSEVFTILLMKKTASDLEHEMNQIKST